jgi:hypothetical protein
MTKFVRCSVESIKYFSGVMGGGDTTVTNNPVNVSLYKYISKGKFGNDLPALRFHDHKHTTTWVYKSAEMRDADFERVANNEF